MPFSKLKPCLGQEVNRDFAGLLEKLRVHSQLDAADYLDEQLRSFMKCTLSSQYTLEPHAAILRAMLSLARSPTQVPGRVVRMLRGIYESRKKREKLQQRQAGEHAQDRKMLMELELQQARSHAPYSSTLYLYLYSLYSYAFPQIFVSFPDQQSLHSSQVADHACEDWEEAWSVADLVMDETVSCCECRLISSAQGPEQDFLSCPVSPPPPRLSLRLRRKVTGSAARSLQLIQAKALWA